MRLALPFIFASGLALAGGFGSAISGAGPALPSSSDGGASAAPQSIAGVGDSIMNGYGAPSPLVTVAASLGPGAFAVNAGMPGEQSNEIAARWLATGATLCGVQPCKYLWFEGGVNDLRRVVATPAQVVANMSSAVDDALSKGYRVVWSDILPSRGSDDGMTTDAVIDATLSYNALMLSACTARAAQVRLRCVFAYSIFVDPTQKRVDGVTVAGYLLPVYSRDGLHLSSAGSAALGTLALQALQAIP